MAEPLVVAPLEYEPFSQRPDDWICVNGVIRQRKDFPAGISVRADHSGGTGFGGTRAYETMFSGTRPPDISLPVHLFALKYHLKRLRLTGERMGVLRSDLMKRAPIITRSVGEMIYDAYATYEANGGKFSYLRSLIKHWEGDLGVRMANNAGLAVVFEFLPLGDYYGKTVKLLVSERYTRSGDPRAFLRGKSGGLGTYIFGGLIREEAEEVGLGDGLYTYVDITKRRFGFYPDMRPYIAEAGASNFAGITRDGRFVTPPPSAPLLFGFTMQFVSKLAKKLGLKVEWRPILLGELLSGKFIAAIETGTAAQITPVSEIRKAGKGACTLYLDVDYWVIQRLQELFSELVVSGKEEEMLPEGEVII